jgi:hypothetical protein
VAGGAGCDGEGAGSNGGEGGVEEGEEDTRAEDTELGVEEDPEATGEGGRGDEDEA